MDAVSDILGTTGKGATADVIMGLYRERGKPGARLAITGRDVEEKVLDLVFDPVLGIWQLEGEVGQVITDKQKDLLDILRMLDGATVGEVAEALGRNKGTAYNRLADLESKGLVYRKANLWYVVE
jgi:predicted transcriptional regulator